MLRGNNRENIFSKDKQKILFLDCLKKQIHLDELIQNLIKDSRLTHRQIANFLGISNNVVRKVSLKKD